MNRGMLFVSAITCCLLMAGCIDVSVKRVKGATKDGYTSYKTTLHMEVVDEPVCEGSCKR